MYTQKVSIPAGRQKIRVADRERIPKYCYIRAKEDGTSLLAVYAISQCGGYAVCEGYSDRTAFVLLKLLSREGEVWQAEYADCCGNPMDEMYAHLTQVHWYEEQGFCKLEFFSLDTGESQIKRLYFC